MAGNAFTIEIEPLIIRADVSTYDPETRTAELIVTTGAPVDRYDWNSGAKYLERLSMKPDEIRLDRLNAGAPLLDSHASYSIADQIGVVLPGTARIEKGKLVATVQFSARENVAPIVQDVRDGIVRSVSVGYRVHAYEEKPAKGGKPAERMATDWEPFEVSLVSMPADTGARVRGEATSIHNGNSCVITRQQEKTMPEKPKTDEQVDERSEFLRENAVADPKPRLALADKTEEPTDVERALTVERERVQGILDAIDATGLPRSYGRKLIDEKVPLVKAQSMIFREVRAARDPESETQPRGGARGSYVEGDRLEGGTDHEVHKRTAIENAILHRVDPDHFKLSDEGRDYRGMTLLDVARVYTMARGIRTTGMSKMELASVSLGLSMRSGGMHSTSDFPLLLADVANKSLRAAYEAVPQTFQPITRQSTLTDFKAANRVLIGDAPALLKVNESGEFTRGTIAESREQIQLASYGRVFSLTRQALVNDDLSAFSRVPGQFGRAARNLESDLVWYQILKNANMGDGAALFVAAHGNLSGAGLISIANIGAAEKAMLLQTGLDGATPIMATPRYLIVPPSLKTKAMQFVSVNMTAAQASNVNPYAGTLTVIAEPRLELGVTIGSASATGSATAWYLAASPDQVDIVEMAMLEGQSGPVVESRIGFDVDGLEIKCRHDVGAKVLDWRGLYKNDGSVES